MTILSKVNSVIVKVLEYLLALLLFGSVALIVAQVFTRYVLHNPLGWTEQMARFFFIWMMMLGVAVVFYRDQAMAFDLLLHSMKDPVRYFVELFIKLVVIFFTVYYGVFALKLAIQVSGRYTSGVRVPLSFMYSSMFVSNVLTLFILLEKVIDIIKDGKKRIGGKNKS